MLINVQSLSFLLITESFELLQLVSNRSLLNIEASSRLPYQLPFLKMRQLSVSRHKRLFPINVRLVRVADCARRAIARHTSGTDIGRVANVMTALEPQRRALSLA